MSADGGAVSIVFRRTPFLAALPGLGASSGCKAYMKSA